MIDALRIEFQDLVARTDYVLDEALVRAAVRQYLKARVRVLERDRDPIRHSVHIRRRRDQIRLYRSEGGPGLRRGKDVVLKPQRGRRKLFSWPPYVSTEAARTAQSVNQNGRTRSARQLPAVEPAYSVVWSGKQQLTVWPDALSESMKEDTTCTKCR